MTLPTTCLSPPFNVTRASHLVLASRDLAKARDFYTEVIGLKVSDESATTIHFRGVEERAHHSLTIRKTRDAAACERIGWRVLTEEDLEKAKAYFDASGLPAKFVNVPFQGRTLHATDRIGLPLELCARMKTQERAQGRMNEHKGAGALRLDHFQVLAPDVASAAAFYAGLGFRISDYDIAGGHLTGTFLYRKDNPHDLVVQGGSGPCLHHVGYIVPEAHHLLRALDSAGALGLGGAVEHGPGPHGHGHSSCLYLRDPDGHRIELLLPPVQMIDLDEEPVRHEVSAVRDGLAVLPPPRAWFEDGTAFPGVAIREAPRVGDPLTLERHLLGKGEAAKAPPARRRA